MITQETAERIWDCYREIEVGKKLLNDMEKERERTGDTDNRHTPTLSDAFGHKQHLQLGIPSGSNSHRLFKVDPELAESVIRAHIAQHEAQLVEANEQARIELNLNALKG